MAICAWCGGEFSKDRSTAVTCSRRCRDARYNASPKGILARERYRKSAVGMAAARARGLRYAKSEKGLACARRNYRIQKAEGRAFYQTAKGREANRIRSARYRLVHSEANREYKRNKAREYTAQKKAIYGKTLSPEQMQKLVRSTVKYQRVWWRGSIYSQIPCLGRWGHMPTEQDLKKLEEDVAWLKQTKERLQSQLAQYEAAPWRIHGRNRTKAIHGN